ncbi:MAG: hypothetical protein R3C18_22560 [Planctomycetaceae bacterium]
MRRLLTWRKNPARTLLMGGCAAILAAAGVAAFAYDDAGSEVGLNGILSPFAPADLEPEALEDLVASLDDTWKDWGKETSALITEFYEGEHPTVESQREVLEKLNTKLKTMASALEDERYESVQPEIRQLYSRLSRRVAIAEAILDTVSTTPEQARQQRLATKLLDLRNAVSAVRADVEAYRNGSVWVEWARLSELREIAIKKDLDADGSAVLADVAGKLAKRGSYGEEMNEFISRESFLGLEDAIKAAQETAAAPVETQEQLREHLVTLMETLDEYDANPDAILATKVRELFHATAELAPDGGETLQNALKAFYLNYNVRILVSEGLVSRVVGEDRQEANWVNDCIMSAHVTGWQCTNATVSADVRPSSNGAKVDLVLDGNVRSNTAGSVPQATVYSVGYYTFNARKAVVFDGHEFKLESARVSASANNQPVDAETKFSGIPLIGPIARNIALNKAEDQMGEVNAYTIQQIRSEVSGELDTEVKTQFESASLELENKVYGPMRKQGLYPDVMHLSSTEDVIQSQLRILGPTELGGSRSAPGVTVPSQGMVIQVHESAMSNGAERFGLAGKTMTETEIRELMESRLTELLGKEFKLDAPAEGEMSNETFVFDDAEAMRFVIEEGEIKVVIRAGLKRENGDIPPQKITVPMSFEIDGDNVVMKRGQVRVEPIPGSPRPANVAEQVARSRIMIGKIESTIPEKTFENNIKVEQQGRSLSLKITSIIAAGGWVTIAAE